MSLTALLVPAGVQGDFMGQLICRAEHDDICHVAVDMGDGWAIAEEFVGCWARPTAQYSNPAIVRWALPLDATQESLAREWLLRQVGARYDFAQLALDGIDLALRCHLRDNSGRYTCSGLVAAACAAAGVYPFGRDVQAVTPGDIHRVAVR